MSFCLILFRGSCYLFYNSFGKKEIVVMSLVKRLLDFFASFFAEFNKGGGFKIFEAG